MNTEKLLDIYTDYLIGQQHLATTTGLSLLLDGQVSHDKVTRFLNSNSFGSKELWQYVKSEVHRHEQERGGVLIIKNLIPTKMRLFAGIFPIPKADMSKELIYCHA
jgi:hypothetical protein